MAIQALFLDFGNIFSTFDFARFYRNLQTLPGVTLTEADLDVIAHRHYYPYDSGKINSREYYEGFVKDMGVHISQDAFEECFLNIFTGHPEGLQDLLEQVRDDVPIYLISNTNEIHYERYIRKHPFLWDHVHQRHHILSYRVGASKPDPRIYRHALDIAGVEAHEGFFVDDVEKNILAWRNLGGAGIVWHGGNDNISALEEALKGFEILV